nr:septum formation inhibitor Maf [Desulfobulbaceae bacterium]
MPLYKTLKPFILASASPRRQEMLRSLGLDFQVRAAEVDECLLAEESPEKYVQRVAGEKAKAIAVTVPEVWVIAADTAVVIADEVLGKPSDSSAALAMLKQLSGKRHRVLSGFCISCFQQNRSVQQISETEVWFNDLSDDILAAYVKTGDPLDKAGAYGIQSFGGVLVKEIFGSYSNVVGLPLAEITNEMLRLGIIGPGS